MSFQNDDPSQGRKLTPVRPASNQPDEFLSPKQAGGYLGVSKSFLDKLRVYGGGPRFLRFGRKILYRKSELNVWAGQRCFSSTSEYTCPCRKPDPLTNEAESYDAADRWGISTGCFGAP